MGKPKILLQLDSDAQVSVFDSVVAIDAGAEHLLRHAALRPEGVEPLVHGAIFTRGLDDLQRTAIFIGGSDVAAGEQLLEAVRRSFVGPFRVSVMIDSSGANTTAAAAVLAVARHVDLAGRASLVLGATGPVGQRVVRLLARCGARVRAGSRNLERATQTCASIRLANGLEQADLTAVATGNADLTQKALSGCEVLISAGAAGVELVSEDIRLGCESLRVAVDLNAVPPVGVAGIEVTDLATERERVICYGAIGVGGTKMKIHKAAVRRLFEARDLVLDAEEVFELGRGLANE